MKTPRHGLKMVLLIAAFDLSAPSAHAALGGPSGVVIPYAGKLELDGALVTGTVDFEFGVAPDASTAAPTTPVSCVFPLPDIPVTNGEFAVSIVIPAARESCVKGKDVHLEVRVARADETLVLLGKQRVTPVVAAATSGIGDFAVTGALTANTAAVTGALSAGALTIGSPVGGNGSTLSTSFRTNAGTLGATVNSELNLGNFGFISPNNSSLAISAFRTAANTDWQGTALLLGMNVDVTRRAGGWISIHGNGNVGIGKEEPSVALDVTGAVKASTTITAATTITAGTTIAAGTTITAGGKSVPTSDEANLKIIRGSVNAFGIVVSGGGFTATKVPGINGLYQIDFTTPFTDTPVVTTSPLGRRGVRVDVYEAGRTTFPANNTQALPSLGGFTAGVLDVNANDDFNFGFSFIAVGPR